jgi:hypothetical protein
MQSTNSISNLENIKHVMWKTFIPPVKQVVLEDVYNNEKEKQRETLHSSIKMAN